MGLTMRPILPTLKERKHYILFKINSKHKRDKNEISDIVTKACLAFLGEFGYAKAGVSFLKETWNSENQSGIIAVNSKYTDQLKVALSLVKEVKIETLKTSGVINKLKQKGV